MGIMVYSLLKGNARVISSTVGLSFVQGFMGFTCALTTRRGFGYIVVRVSSNCTVCCTTLNGPYTLSPKPSV